MELERQKNAATYIVFPIVNADGDFVSGAENLDSEIDAWGDGAAPDGFADCTNEAQEIGTSGIYYLSLTQSEMNNDYIVIQVKTSTTDAKTQMILIRTMVGDPLNKATHTSGRELSVDSNNRAGADAQAISGDSGAADNAESFFDGTGYAGTNNTIPTVTTLTNAPADSSGITTLLARIIGTLATGTHNPQSGDAYSRIGANGAGLTLLATAAALAALRGADNDTLKTLSDQIDGLSFGDLSYDDVKLAAAQAITEKAVNVEEINPTEPSASTERIRSADRRYRL